MCSYTARRLEANTYQFEELALKAITMGLHQLAVELLVNSLAVDEQQEETWCGAGTNTAAFIPISFHPALRHRRHRGTPAGTVWATRSTNSNSTFTPLHATAAA